MDEADEDWQWEKQGLVPVSRVVLSKALIRLSVDGWGCTLFLLVVWAEATCLGAYRLYGRVNGSLQEDSLALQGSPSRITAASASFPHSEPLLTHTSTGDPLTLAGRSGPVSCRSWCMQDLFMPAKSVVSVNPSPVEVLESNTFDLQSQIPLGFLILLLDPPGCEAWHRVQNPHHSGRTYLQFVGCPPNGYGIWFYCDCSSYQLVAASPLSLDLGCLFCGSLCSPIDDCSTAHCDFGTLIGGDDCTHVLLFHHRDLISCYRILSWRDNGITVEPRSELSLERRDLDKWTVYWKASRKRETINEALGQEKCNMAGIERKRKW